MVEILFFNMARCINIKLIVIRDYLTTDTFHLQNAIKMRQKVEKIHFVVVSGGNNIYVMTTILHCGL